MNKFIYLIKQARMLKYHFHLYYRLNMIYAQNLSSNSRSHVSNFEYRYLTLGFKRYSMPIELIDQYNEMKGWSCLSHHIYTL